jgi:lysylphosphatidylglycerol synthetase-like protein (DUF2156 family)
MKQGSVGIRIAPFAVGVICFILPFVQISCDGKKMMSMTGVQLVTGSEMKDPMTEKTKKIPAEPLAVVTLLAMLAGAGLSISAKRGSAISSAVAGGVAAIAMLVLKTRMDAEVTKQASGFPITVEYLVGFWVVCLAAVAGIVLSVMRTKEDKPTG